MIWREAIDYVTDCYYLPTSCINLKGTQKEINMK